MNRLEQTRQESIRVWAQAQRQALHEAVRNTPVAPPAVAAAGTGVGAGGSFETGLTLEFSSVEGAQEYVANLTSVAEWNTFFDLPSFGTPFTRVAVDEATITLYGGSGITIKEELFFVSGINEILVAVDDQSGCITGLGNDCFSGCEALTTVSLPALTTAGDYCFYLCTALTSISLPALETAGVSCFQACSALTTVSLPALTNAISDLNIRNMQQRD